MRWAEKLAAVADRMRSPPTPGRAFARSVRPLASSPQLGPALDGRWDGCRVMLKTWRWLPLIDVTLADDDRVVVVTVQHARSSTAVTSMGRPH